MTSERIGDSQPTDAVEWIADRLIQSSIEYADERIGWVAVDGGNSTGVTLHATRSIYRGQLGIALFFGAHHAVLGDDRSARIAKRAARPWLACNLEELTHEYTGIGTGIGSLVYALTTLHRFLKDRAFADRTVALLEHIDENMIVGDTNHDVVYGNAGLLLALLAAAEIDPTGVSIERARRVGDHLIDVADSQKEGISWKTTADHYAAGFAHGNAGIAYALLTLAVRENDSAYRLAAERAVTFENNLFDEDHERWRRGPDVVEHRFGTGWCWGNPGIGLARAASCALLDEQNATWTRDIWRALTSLDLTPRNNDCLCHGTFGDVAILFDVGRRFDESYCNRAHSVLTDAVQRWRRKEHFQFPHSGKHASVSPSMFLGLAGIGYTILRVKNPETVPSILLFE